MTRPDPPAVVRARLLLTGLFTLAGITFASWLARLPTVRDLLDLGTADLGLLLLVGSVGSLLTVTTSGMLLERWGSRRVLLVSTFVLAAALVLLGTGPTVGSVALLAAGIFLNGVAVALGNVAINVESARVERALGRTVIPQFHAAFSVGAVVGSGLGALASAGGVPVAVQLPATAALMVVWRLASLPRVVLPASAAETAERSVGRPLPADATASRARRGVRRVGAALGAWRERRTLLVGVVVLAAAFSEGAANNWLSLAVVDGFGTSEAVGGAALGLFVASMTAVRLLGTRLLDRYGRVAVLRASGASSVVGLLLFGFAPTFALAAAGVVLWGVGAALAVPIGIAAASDDPVRAAGRVAVVSAFASMASLVAPPVLGLAAESVGARHALTLIVVAMVLSVVVAPAVARDATAPGGAPARPADAPAAPAGRQAAAPADGDLEGLVRSRRHHVLPGGRRRARRAAGRPPVRGAAR
ncbi:MFS transporter [Cellulomonas wangsupingiae]|uniref:MFS transporter n=1 Tax=Cellulomonas wangsupingiae TaxID=2968085 RepID=A0ABY5K1A6_9CELL|nr:MFS transporter [Cellulomonas wangsupingiae]MCC2336710.1 MFS transporter [Cellulomonas wangsupingiae]UUI64234.1 MFS transporter [Cellulomonas wangsupingiae]